MVKQIDSTWPPEGPITLYVTAPEYDADQSLRRALSRGGLEVEEPFPHVLAITCNNEQLREVCAALSQTEREHIVCHVSIDGQEPTASQLMQSRSLQRLSDRMDAEWIDALVSENRLQTFFQPIISNREPFEIFAHECLLRGIDGLGNVIPPMRLIAAAREASLLPVLDQAAQLVAIETATRYQLNECVFINFNPRLLDLGTSSLDRTIQATLESGLGPERFVFEVVESDQIDDRMQLLKILDLFREAGCRVALDDVGAGYNSLHLLTEVKPDFVKLDMQLIRGVHKDIYKSCVARKLLELSRELGVMTVAEGVETMDEWQWTRDHGADLVQGYLFATPSSEPKSRNTIAVLAAGCDTSNDSGTAIVSGARNKDLRS